MKEIWEQALLSYNLPLTIALGLVFIYWLLAVLGTIDMEALDFDFDIDTDSDLDTDITPGSSGFFVTALKFVNATDVPLMMVLSFLSLFMWLIAILSNYYFNPDHSSLFACGLLFVNFFMSVLLVKLITKPFIPFFNAFKKGENDDEPVIGRIGIVKSKLIDSEYGQVEVPRQHGSPAIVNARMGEGHSPLPRGSEVLLYDNDQESHLFIVREANSAEKSPPNNNQPTTLNTTL